MLRYYSHSRHLKEIFDFPVRKICVDAGFTCPNRDGSKGYGGCIYCNDKGSGAPYINKNLSWEDQFRIRAERHLQNEPNTHFIIYFQAYSNTYAPVEYLEQMYRSALSKEKVVGLSIGTRPDCVNSESLNLIRDLSRETYVWLEFGVETIHEKTLQLINRQHTYADLLTAYDEAKKRDISICLHIINGLPWESREEILETAKTVGQLMPDGIKMHSLYIETGTRLHNLYKKNPWLLFSENEYIELAVECLELFPEQSVIQRLVGEAIQERLVAPEWSKNKQRILNGIQNYMESKDTKQGAKYAPIQSDTVASTL